MSKAAQFPPKPPTIALITNDVIGERMAGPGIRYWELARVLGQRCPVKLIVPPVVPMDSVPVIDSFPASIHICTRLQDLHNLVEDCDVIVTLGTILFFYPFLSDLGKPLVLDMYSPFLLEGLQREIQADFLKQLTSHENYLDSLRSQLAVGDFFICAAEKQRDYWLGALSAMGRINPYTYEHDPTLRRLIDVVPFGLPENPPKHTHAVLKGVHRAIAAEDKVILWGGGIWNWFDPLTLIRAMSLIVRQRTDVKLFFMGIHRPNRDMTRMQAVDQAIALSQELELYEKYIFFNDWVSYDERQNYLLEADIGVSLHLDHAETRFAFRTRILDYLWAGLPVVSTRGDVMSETLATQNLAYLVAPGDVTGVAETILALLDNPSLRTDHASRFQQVAPSYRWEVVAQPLLEFCHKPYLAPDKAYLRQKSSPVERQNSKLRLLSKGWRALQLGGVPRLLHQSHEYLRWKINKRQKL